MMKAKLLKIIRKRVYIKQIEYGVYQVIDNKITDYAAGIPKTELESVYFYDLKIALDYGRKYILENMHTIRNENKYFWQKNKYLDKGVKIITI